MKFHIIDKREKILKEKEILINEFYKKDSIKYILGINEFTDNLLKYCLKRNIVISGIIDDFTKEDKYKNLKIIKSEELDNKNVLIVSCVIDARLKTANDKLKKNKFLKILNYLELCLVDKELDNVHHMNNNFNDIINNRDKYIYLEEFLTDNLSKNILNNIIDFRFNYNIEALDIFKFNLENQYFDDFIKFGDNEVFVDCGGFDGKTTEKFIKLCPNYKSIYYFEPIKDFFINSKKTLRNYKNIKYFNKGTYKSNTILNFSKNSSMSSISENGDEKVTVIKLDDVIKEKVTYIKMDVEGCEYDSLIGCREIIKKYKPKLAICVYHKQEDFWRIPELILSYNKDYRVYLRHYTEGLLETVMYFI